jgi:beta-phosphoglucomutase-like phosphatase (HAD superfamily)
VPDLLQRTREAGLRIAIASSAKDELEKYLDIAGVKKLIDEMVSSEDVEESKPAPEHFRSRPE